MKIGGLSAKKATDSLHLKEKTLRSLARSFCVFPRKNATGFLMGQPRF
jgi:hypothetical protein